MVSGVVYEEKNEVQSHPVVSCGRRSHALYGRRILCDEQKAWGMVVNLTVKGKGIPGAPEPGTLSQRDPQNTGVGDLLTEAAYL